MKVDPILVATVALMAVVVILVVGALASNFSGDGGGLGRALGPPCICPDCPGDPAACAPCTGRGNACGAGGGCGSGEKCDPSLLARGAEIAGCCVGSAAAPGAPDCCCKNHGG